MPVGPYDEVNRLLATPIASGAGCDEAELYKGILLRDPIVVEHEEAS